MWNNISILFSPTGIYVFIYLPILIYDVNNILLIFFYLLYFEQISHTALQFQVLQLTNLFKLVVLRQQDSA